MVSAERLRSAYLTARDALLRERVPEGHWVGELSTSALSTATAVMALHLVNPFEHRERIDAGMKWLADHQNADGGWGDTVKSFSNISTTMLCRAAFKLVGEKDHTDTVVRVEEFITLKAGALPARRAAAIRARYGKDHTFSVPILMTCALAGLVKWEEVPRLPFEAAYLPQSWYRFAKMPVVSYALPALIAIGQCIHHHRRSRNPIRNAVRRFVRNRTLNVLRRIQPTSGGYLEATPLTSFVVMALASMRRKRSEAEGQVIAEGVRFIVNSVRAGRQLADRHEPRDVGDDPERERAGSGRRPRIARFKARHSRVALEAAVHGAAPVHRRGPRRVGVDRPPRRRARLRRHAGGGNRGDTLRS